MENKEKQSYAPPLPKVEKTPTDLELVSEANGHTIFKSKSTGKLFSVEIEKYSGKQILNELEIERIIPIFRR